MVCCSRERCFASATAKIYEALSSNRIAPGQRCCKGNEINLAILNTIKENSVVTLPLLLCAGKCVPIDGLICSTEMVLPLQICCTGLLIFASSMTAG